MRVSKLILPLSLSVLISGCSLFSTQSEIDQQSQGTPQQWQAHQQTIKPINSWDILGKIAIRTERDSGSANLTWKQKDQEFDIALVGPLGQGATRLSGAPGFVQLNVANQGEFYAASAEHLMHEQLGWSLPVQHLLWWVRGLPSPASKNQVKLDAQGRLAQLSQDGWRVDYLSYSQENDLSLPQRLKLKGPQLEITLVVKQWNARSL